MAKESMAACATRHMVNGITDTEELIRLIGQDLGDVPSRNSVHTYRKLFRRHGSNWQEEERVRNREANKRWRAENPEAHREASKRSYAKNPEAYKETTKRWKAENPARKLLNACRANAKKRGHECTLTIEDIEQLLEPMICSVTGLALSWDDRAESDKYRWLAPSVDRIDNNVGYNLDNVRVVCVAFNQMRSDIPDDVVTTVAKALVGSTHH
ncbi:hypothetical protein JCM14076_19000 [Methylosoma difficile]